MLFHLLPIILFPFPLFADFHVVGTQKNDGPYLVSNLPSNKYDCRYVNRFGILSSGSLASGYFQTKGDNRGDTCGINTLNFYRRGNGKWQIYQEGNGNVKGECYDNSAAENFDVGQEPRASCMNSWFASRQYVIHKISLREYIRK